MKTPDSADCASSVALGNATVSARRVPALLHQQARARRRVLLRIDGDPAAVLHLLDTHQVIAVIARAVETQLALDRVDAVLLQVRGDRLIVQASGALDA